MMRTIAFVGAVALLGATAGSAGVPGHAARARLSDSSAGARPVVLTIGLPAELRCGQLAAVSLTVILPRAMRAPRSIARSAVRLGGKPVQSVQKSGSTIVVYLPHQHGATCLVIVHGVARLQFARGADLGNPRRAGSYAFTVEARPGREVWRGSLVVRS
jgi:hypothetical protein